MNMEIEKKWFVYVGDHHEGPFSVPEMAARQESGSVTPESYVWCEGMADWLMLSQVNELERDLKDFKAAVRPAATKLETKPAAKPAAGRSAEPEVVEASAPAPKAKLKSKKNIPLILTATLLVLVFGSFLGLAALSRSASEEVHASLRPFLARLVQTIPALSSAFQLVPTLSDIKEDEFFELEAARGGLVSDGARIALALSQQDPNRPFFYVATNLPHGTRFEIHLVGQSETLLNRLQFNTQGTLSTTQGFGKSEVFLAEGGQPLPKGRYLAYLVEASDQEAAIKEKLASIEGTKAPTKLPASIPATAKFVVSKSLFIGGERDETYLSRLKAFHEKIRTNAEKELQELKQYAQTLDTQFNTLTSDFQKVFSAKKPSAALKNAWNKNSGAWTQISGQMDQTIQTWSKETLQNEFFYGKIYEQVKASHESMKTLIQLESGFIEKPTDKNTFEIQHGKLLSDTRQALEGMKQKLEMALKAPKSPAGLPSREGL
jgi:hypothetical protein